MPNTRKKVVKTVYKDEDSNDETGDFSDSGSEAQISEPPTSDEEEIEDNSSSAVEFDRESCKRRPKKPAKRKTKFTNEFINKICKRKQTLHEDEENEVAPALLTVKDLSDADKLLPSLNLSESDSSDDDTPKPKRTLAAPQQPLCSLSEDEQENEYNDVWCNTHDNSAELAKKAFMELEQHKNTYEEMKASVQNYVQRTNVEHEKESNVKDLLALGEEEPTTSPKIIRKAKRNRVASDSEVEDWEEVKETKSIPQQGLQLVVALPDSVCRKSKKVDVEMMMKRKINRVKKEHQVFMHKVHVLCWLGHGNYVSRVLNDQEIMGVLHSIVPKGCYPKDRLDMKYVEQITTWFKEKFSVKPDKHENKFRPKAPPLKTILLEQIKKRVFTSKKYLVFVFVSMLRALGLQTRVLFNFVTLPLKPPSSELCSLSTKPKTEKLDEDKKDKSSASKTKGKTTNASKIKQKIPQLDGIHDSFSSSEDEFDNIIQVDGNDDAIITKTRSLRSSRSKKAITPDENNVKDDGVSPPKKSKKDLEPQEFTKPNNKQSGATSKSPQNLNKSNQGDSKNAGKDSKSKVPVKSLKNRITKKKSEIDLPILDTVEAEKSKLSSAQNTRKTKANNKVTSKNSTSNEVESKLIPHKLTITNENEDITHSHYFSSPDSNKNQVKVERSTRKRSATTAVIGTIKSDDDIKKSKVKTRTKSAPGISDEKSKYFDESEAKGKITKLTAKQLKQQEQLEDNQRVSHKDLLKPKVKPKGDVTGDLISIVKTRIKHAKEEAKQGIVKGKVKEESDDDSDYLPVEDPKRNSDSEDEFKPKTKISPRAPKLSPVIKRSTNKKIDRRVFSTDDELKKKEDDNSKKIDVWCEIFVEELEQWIAVDIVKGKVHSASDLYSHATHPVCYIVGWDNNNYLKDLTRRYVPHWNTVTRKQRAEPEWWSKAIEPWVGPRNARDREEDEALDRMQMEAPLPKSIAEYKNHPLYALKRHLLKFEAIYPPDAATLGFVRNEPVYARECVYTCRSRDTWLKEAKVVKLGEEPYKVVKARPKWDKLSNKLITDKPLEVFGPWQVQDYEPPTAENGKVPRNAYGNVELFKECMLPKGTVHIKLPGLNKVARKLDIDCAPAMTGFDFNGGWSHPVYDGFVVCEEFEEIITEAWVKDQEEQERRELEKLELRVYGNWKRLIKGLLIRERLKLKYGFEEPSTSLPSKSKAKGPRLVVKKRS